MRALVISGGGSKGAFAGGVAQYLLEVKKYQYDLFLGTSTGSLLIPHLALGNIEKIHSIYTNVSMRKIFNISPFIVKEKNGVDIVTINHFNVLRQFLKERELLEKVKDCTNTSKRTLHYLISINLKIYIKMLLLR